MPIAHILEDFNSARTNADAIRMMSDVALEDHRLASFEQGYSAGWEDAFAAQEQDQTRITGELARSLEDLSFTYQEAMSQFTASLEPVFRCLIDLVLPEIMAHSLGQHIVEMLRDLAQQQSSDHAVLVVPVGAKAALKPILAHDLAVPLDIREDADIENDKACLRVGSAEREFDGNALLASVREALDAFNYQSLEEIQNG